MSQTFIDAHQARQLMAAWRRTYGRGRPPTRVHEPAPSLAAASRAEGDAQAAWRRWHDPGVDAGFTATEWPWYRLLEQARVETLASRHLPGMAHNLSHLEALSPTDPAMARLYQVARCIFGGQADAPHPSPPPQGGAVKFYKSRDVADPTTPPFGHPSFDKLRQPLAKEGKSGWLPPWVCSPPWLRRGGATRRGGSTRKNLTALPPQGGRGSERLPVVKLAGEAPGRNAPRLARFGLRWPWQAAPVDRKDPPVPLSDASIAEALNAARILLSDGPRFAETLHPLVRALSDFYDPGAPGNPARDPAQSDGDAAPDGHSASDEERPDAEMERPGGPNRDFTPAAAFPGYAVFTRAWDEEHPAAHWYRPDDAAALHGLNPLDRRRVRQLAHRLQRRLLAARLRHWSFDQEEGRLDHRRLARLVGTHGDRRIFRIEREAPVPEACVTLLVDQSGSMRGAPQRMAALAIDLAVHTLEACQVRCEVLGYTTRFGADNPVSRRWRERGAPEAPGRLNALRHILYKTAAQPWRRARSSLGLLLREGFGYENIDGEALDWAARRLLRQPQPRKVLVVLSDGSPYDEATASANSREYLENHLRAVIAGIESSPIQLVAIGTGQEVGRFYRQAVTVRRPEAVAEVLFERLGDLLTQPDAVEKF